MKDYVYHQWSISDLEKHFEVDSTIGLSQKKAIFRLKNDGKNSFSSLKEKSSIHIFFRQFLNLFILILIIASIISYYVDGWYQALFLVAIVMINILLGFFQENKAERSLAALKRSFRSKARVLRGSNMNIIDSEELVIGDVVILESGDKIPADLRIIEDISLRVDESSLTGESIPGGKNIGILPLETPLADRSNMAYSSTIVVDGHGRGIVVATGKNTEFGKIAELVEKTDEKTPLEKNILYLAKVISIAALAIAILIFVLGYFRGMNSWELLTFTIALLVSAVPESLPTAITLALAVGVTRMASKKAIVRRLAVIEAIGRAQIIATDKTGTLTDNNLSVDKVFSPDNGNILEIDPKSQRRGKELITLFSEGLACSNIDLSEKDEFVGDPVEKALADWAVSSKGFSLSDVNKYKRLSEVPFSSEKKYMAVLVNNDRTKSLIVKGAPEVVLSFCDLGKDKREEALLFAENLSKMGYKVIALADKNLGKISSSALVGMEFRCFFALVDEPTAGIKEAIAQTISAGVRPIILTGDHPETARFVANKIGLAVQDQEILTTEDIEKMTKKELVLALKNVKIFARVTPEDKINIVRLLKEMGYSVMVTGDGVNDAPALKEADVGIAMGIKGTDVAKDAADVVLSDDKYGTIVHAIQYGRTIFDNIKNVTTYLVSVSLDQVGLVCLAFIFGLPVPFTTLQILWTNLITDSFPALALALGRPDPNILKEPPMPIKSDPMKKSISYALLLAVVSVALALILYVWGLNISGANARTLVFCFIVFLELIYALSIQSKKRIWESPRSFFANKLLLVAIGLSALMQIIIFIPPLRPIFHIVPLNIKEVAILLLFSIITFISAELIRFWLDRKTIVK